MTSKYVTERDIVQRFLAACGIARTTLIDPNQGRTTDSGADVVWTRDQSVIGFQFVGTVGLVVWLGLGMALTVLPLVLIGRFIMWWLRRKRQERHL